MIQNSNYQVYLGVRPIDERNTGLKTIYININTNSCFTINNEATCIQLFLELYDNLSKIIFRDDIITKEFFRF